MDETRRENEELERGERSAGCMGHVRTLPRFEFDLASGRYPRVLLLGNGILRLRGGVSWESLLSRIAMNDDIPDEVLREIPMAMRVEALCGADVEGARLRAAGEFEPIDACVTDTLRRLLSLPWDCVLTTNYTYEAEGVLLNRGRFGREDRSRMLACMNGSVLRRDNLHFCYIMEREGLPPLPVWHIHGDLGRPESMILSYYSYAKAISRLQKYNRKLKNAFQEAVEARRTIVPLSWSDWFILGDVYSVGFGYDFSEFDLWWAAERKARENAAVGRLIAYQDRQEKSDPVCALLKSIGAEVVRVRDYEDYAQFYGIVIDDIEKRMRVE
ncbi:MAG: hypothetical protein Q4C10_04360 [Clostridia bacterium]|nr:hypothetical protein [Clostridia bacterium]